MCEPAANIRVPVHVVAPWFTHLSITGVPSTNTRTPSSDRVENSYVPAANDTVLENRPENVSTPTRRRPGPPDPKLKSIDDTHCEPATGPANAVPSNHSTDH